MSGSDVLMDGQTVDDSQIVDDVDGGQTVAFDSSSPSPSMTAEALTEAVADAVVDSVVGFLSERLDALEAGLASVSGRLQVDGLSERLDALSDSAATKDDVQALSVKVDEATLQGEEIGPVIGELVEVILGDAQSAVLDLIEGNTADTLTAVRDIRSVVGDISDTLLHPAMTTNFADYTVLEALLLLSLLFSFVKLWLYILGRGFYWLR